MLNHDKGICDKIFILQNQYLVLYYLHVVYFGFNAILSRQNQYERNQVFILQSHYLTLF